MKQTWWRWLIAGPDFEPRESAHAFRTLMAQAQRDLETGAAQPARVLHRRYHPKKVLIGTFQARLLRMRRRG